MNEIHVVASGDIVFVDHPKYYDKALTSEATIILINKKVDCPVDKSLLISDDPFRDFNILTNYFNPFIAATSTISKTAIIGENTILQPNVFVGNNVKIGNDCLIHSNVCIYDNTVIGNNVTIHSGTILGADAFYYKNRPDKPCPYPSNENAPPYSSKKGKFDMDPFAQQLCKLKQLWHEFHFLLDHMQLQNVQDILSTRIVF